MVILISADKRLLNMAMIALITMTSRKQRCVFMSLTLYQHNHMNKKRHTALPQIMLPSKVDKIYFKLQYLQLWFDAILVHYTLEVG